MTPTAKLQPEAIAEVVHELVRDELDWHGPMPTGDLREAFDSMALMTLCVAIEDRFLIVLEPEDEARVDTLDDLIQVVHERVTTDAARLPGGTHAAPPAPPAAP